MSFDPARSARRVGVALAIAFSAATQAPGGDEPTKASPMVLGVSSCRGCHGDPELKNARCRMIEYRIWAEADPHAQALAWGSKTDKVRPSAAAGRAWEIGRRLGIEDVATSPRCVSCHSVAAPRGTPATADFNPKNEGVNCSACHGAYKEWALQHQLGDADPAWKAKNRRQKWLEFGMIDLWDPVTRSNMCTSCHIGDPQAAKVLTHDMYVAGHPPLPVIETAFFSELEPRHWLPARSRSGAAKGEGGRRAAVRLEETEQALAGGLVALARTMELLEADARRRGPASDAATRSEAPDFARYDCRGCHHDLKRPEDRSESPVAYRGNFGRPPEPAWPRVSAEIALESLNPQKARDRSAKLAALMNDLRNAYATDPFGDARRVEPAARSIVEWTRGPLAELTAISAAAAAAAPATTGPARAIDAPEAKRILRRLVAAGDRGDLDIDSARGIVWTFATIVQELQDVSGRSPLSTAQARILGELEAELALDPAHPRGPAAPVDQASGSRPARIDREIVDHTLKPRLNLEAKFDLPSFRKRLKLLNINI